MKKMVLLLLITMVFLVPTINFLAIDGNELEDTWIDTGEPYSYNDDQFGQYLLENGVLSLFPKANGEWPVFMNLWTLARISLSTVASPIFNLLDGVLPDWLIPKIEEYTTMWHEEHPLDWEISQDYYNEEDDVSWTWYHYVGDADIETIINNATDNDYSINLLYYSSIESQYKYQIDRLWGLLKGTKVLTAEEATAVFGAIYD